MNEFEDLPIESFGSICRTCLISSNIFSISKISWEGVELKEIVASCTSIEIEDQDKMPKNICEDCIRKFYTAFRFFTVCRKSNEILSCILRKSRKNALYSQRKYSEEIENDNMDIDSDDSDSIDNDNGYTTDVDVKYEKIESEREDLNARSDNNIILNEIYTIKDEIEQLKVEKHDTLRKLAEADQTSEPPKRRKPTVKYSTVPDFYTCYKCDKIFNDLKSFKRHRIETNHLQRDLACPYCPKVLKEPRSYKRHIRTHTGEKPFKCPTCGKAFCCKSDIRRHRLSIHSEEKPYTCKYCSKGFVQKQYWLDHERRHTGERLPCTICGKEFRAKASLQAHEKLHRDEDRLEDAEHSTDKLKKPTNCKNTSQGLYKPGTYQCHLCGKVVVTQKNLQDHILLHGPRQFKCDTCGKFFISKGRLNGHIKFAHTDEKYPCPICGYCLKDKNYMDDHMKTHTGENVYPCEHCGRKFGSRTGLRDHRRIHTGDTKYQCKICLLICRNTRHLQVHVRSKHTGERPFVCEVCGKAFSSKTTLANHVKVHYGKRNHLCNLCGHAFFEKRGLRRHLLRVHGREENAAV